MRKYIFPFLFLAGAGLFCYPNCGQEAKPEVSDCIKMLRTSKDSEKLASAALILCQSKEPKGLNMLLPFLVDGDFLNRLDTDIELRTRSNVRIIRITDALAKNGSESAQRLLLQLSRDKIFIAHVARLDCLIESCGHLQRPLRELLDFLESHAKPGYGETQLIVEVLTRIGTPEAARILTELILSPKHDNISKGSWFIYYISVKRNSLNMIRLYRNVLSSIINDKELLETIVQSLFDYLPEDVTPPMPPPRKNASTEALEEMLKVAEMALKLEIDDKTKASVRKAKREVEAILEFRRSGGLEKIERWIVDLDDDRFQIREEAEKNLEKVLEYAEDKVKAALRADPSVEKRKRLKRLLGNLDKRNASPND